MAGDVPDWWDPSRQFPVRATHSYRNFRPVEVANLIYYTDRATGRGVLDYIESGRLEPALAETTNMVVAMDLDEIRDFWRGSPEWARWCSVWAVANHYASPSVAVPSDVPLWPNGDGPSADFMNGRRL